MSKKAEICVNCQNGVWVGTCANYSNRTQTGFWYSTNGIDWRQSNVTSGSSQDLIYANGVWLCRSSDDGNFYSSDGQTRESLDINTYAPVYVNCLWICSSGSYVCYSEDGKTWTQTDCPCLAMGQTSCANGVWLRTGYTIMPKDATDIGVFYSIDGKNWSQADFPLVEQYERIEFNPTSIKNEDGHTLCEEVPIIVKLIDAERDLSIQVHPPTEDESLMPGINGKSELWHVVDCKPGAFVYCGFNRGIAKF